MKNNRLVAWGIILSIGLAILIPLLELNEDFYQLAGLGMIVFGIWASVILFKNAE